jgi:transcriptional regulator with XRE-family HTH domain
MSREKLNIVNNFSERLKVLIKRELKISQVEFAKKIGTSEGYVSGIINQGKGPSADIIAGIFLNYGEHLNWLLTGKEPMKQAEEKSIFKVTEGVGHYYGTGTNSRIEEDIREILASGDDEVIEKFKERLKDFKTYIRQKKENEEMKDRLLRIEKAVENSPSPGRPSSSRESGTGQTEESDTEKKAM